VPDPTSLESRELAEAGFSLIETVVAAALLGVLTLSTLLTIIPISRQTRLSREVEAATYAVSDTLERIHATPFNEILILHPDGQSLDVDTLPSGQLSITYDDPTADPLVMTISLSWVAEDGGSIVREFTTVRTE